MDKLKSINYNYTEELVYNLLLGSSLFSNSFSWRNVYVVVRRRDRLRELDLVFLNENGLWCFEIKGGSVKHDSEGWHFATYSVNYDPFKKLYDTSFKLLLSLKNIYRKDKRLFPGIKLYYCICFPDIVFNIKSVSWDKRTIFDKNSFKDIDKSLIKLKNFHESSSPKVYNNLSDHNLKTIKGILDSYFTINESLDIKDEKVNNEIIKFTSEQNKAYRYLSKNKYVIVDGVPGSGKSVLAKNLIDEKIKAISSKGKVLHICSNKIFLMNNYPETIYRDKPCEFYSYNEFLKRLSNIQNRDLKDWPDSNNSGLIEYIIKNYTVIVFDEAQDYYNLQFEKFILNLLNNNQLSVYIFLDSKFQKYIYNPKLNLENSKLIKKNFFYIELPLNLRNSREIINTVNLKTSFEIESKITEPGKFIEYLSISDENSLQKIEEILTELYKDNFKPEDITFLTLTSIEKSIYTKLRLRFNKLNIYLHSDHNGEKHIKLYPSLLFKGMESKIVIIIDWIDRGKTLQYRSLCLMTMTRAKSICYLIKRN